MKIKLLISDLTLDPEKLFSDLEKQHERYQNEYPLWTIAATRRRVIFSYWLKNVVLDNYVILILSGTLIAWILHIHQPIRILLLAGLPAYILTFFVLFVFLYYPAFHNEFLPLLDNWMESYKGSQLEGIQKCKKDQYSIVALMLIETTYRELAGLDVILNNTTTVETLARQYGVSVKAVGSALNLITRGDWNRKSARKRTEILDDFETAKQHFKQLYSEKAIVLLNHLEQRILQASPK